MGGQAMTKTQKMRTANTQATSERKPRQHCSRSLRSWPTGLMTKMVQARGPNGSTAACARTHQIATSKTVAPAGTICLGLDHLRSVFISAGDAATSGVVFARVLSLRGPFRDMQGNEIKPAFLRQIVNTYRKALDELALRDLGETRRFLTAQSNDGKHHLLCCHPSLPV